ncbi:hypothetical protein F2P56_005656 [Juglans regia]|uniref:GATA transcription factor 9-like n=2 Tax=Juglans regia TaxID=51240 RepID=A0A6P9E9E0_JUGRE|nr:GATA transcription factor 9-like [Juglans regia]KAF5473684.1 hypothetical protein F2P56_005656 [Juglans regia]
MCRCGLALLDCVNLICFFSFFCRQKKKTEAIKRALRQLERLHFSSPVLLFFFFFFLSLGFLKSICIVAMDFYRNVTVAGDYQPEQVLSPHSKLGGLTTSLDELFSAQNTEVDVSLEWLSVFVEDCLSSTGNCLPVPTGVQATSTTPKPSRPLQKTEQNPASLQTFVVPGKARSKRKRATTLKTKNSLTLRSTWSHHFNPKIHALNVISSDPPLLQQAYWLADSELIVPKNEENINILRDGQQEETREEEEGQDEKGMVRKGSLEGSNEKQPMPRRCTHCLAQRTPQWRAGPLGPKTLCNACGVRYKSGRLLPEYRPAKSPTFVSYLHSNSHKKVMEMRMAFPPSIP